MAFVSGNINIPNMTDVVYPKRPLGGSKNTHTNPPTNTSPNSELDINDPVLESL